MQFVGRKNLPFVVVPKVYAYEGPGSRRATSAGAIYMPLEGLNGNKLQDVAFDLCSLPAQVASQDHIITQWTMAQAQLATLAYPQIGSITAITESVEPVIGKLSTAAAEALVP
ncbi:hypothetical protein N7467_000628 [Penicillium canescens]|nr:hypothetical protein N7467_000628 [Penicillium canescens]